MRSDRGLSSGARRDGVWPRIYRPTRGYRLFLGGLGVLALAGGVAAAVGILHDPKAPAALGVGIGGGFALLGAFLVASVIRERVALFEDGTVEFTELFRGRTRLRPAEIAGLRSLSHQGVTYAFFHFREQARKPFKVGLICERDEHFDRWLAAFPDLDSVERAAAEEAILNDAALGDDPAAREAALARARLLTRLLSGAAWAAVAWGWFRPRPYEAAIATLAAIPALAVALLFAKRGVVGVDERRNDPRPSVLVPILMPGLVLTLRGLLDFHVVDARALLAWAAPLALALTGLLVAGDAQLRRRWFMPPLAFLFAAPLAWGAVAEANVLLDASPPQRHRVAVTGKHVSSGKVTTWKVTLAPFGSVETAEDADLRRADYDAIRVGDELCVALHAGRLGARWLDVRRCD
jgi:hypothetical protein